MYTYIRIYLYICIYMITNTTYTYMYHLRCTRTHSGICDDPEEYPGLGAPLNFGCVADCGAWLNVTTITINLKDVIAKRYVFLHTYIYLYVYVYVYTHVHICGCVWEKGRQGGCLCVCGWNPPVVALSLDYGQFLTFSKTAAVSCIWACSSLFLNNNGSCEEF